MSNYTLYKLTSGKIAIVAPFHATLVAECRRRMGKWAAINTPSGAGYAWTLDAAHRDAIVALAAELFPSREQLIERVVTWTCDGQWSASSPTMDGYDVAGFSRDGHWIKRFDAGEPLQIIEIVADGLRSYGSRNNPRLGGKVTLRLRCRPQAVAAGDGWNVEVIGAPIE